ncbi:MAG: TrbG/VirB9 family P-type conjugative transfer protein [Alphaproteobacteria bacterium]|nr:TrbG/VirB9 family P-type conjugative transfer protein [Alphaproteobacteria bacterium]
MRRILAGLLVPGWLIVMDGANAATPAADLADPRLWQIDVSQSGVIALRLRPGYATQILLPPDEQVEHAVMGEARGWEVAVFGDSLVLKPLADAEATNLLVTAEDHKGLHRYRFDLSLAATQEPAPFELRLTRPGIAPELALAQAQEAAEARAQALVEQAVQAAPFEGPRNFAYSAQGAIELQPSEVFDNGRFTILRFSAQQPIPSIYEIGPDGLERLVPFHIQDEFLVVHLVAEQLRLRRGARRLCLFNEAFNPHGGVERTGTASGRLVRDLKPETERP